MAVRKLELDLTGDVIAITGGGGVLCSVMARALAAHGAAVAIIDVSQEAATRLAEQVRLDGGMAVPFPCDVLNKEQLEQTAQDVASKLGAPGVLINGAGGNRPEATTGPERSFFDLPKEAVQWVLDLNFVSTVLACQAFGRMMAASGSGNIVNISSMNALRPLTRIPAYSAAKSAVSNFTQWLAVHMNQEYGPGIRVNAIAPGFFLTQQNRFLLLDAQTGELTDRGRAIVEHTPMGRFGEPDDLVGTLLWLLSDSSQFVNGVVVPVDGGFSAFAGV